MRGYCNLLAVGCGPLWGMLCLTAMLSFPLPAASLVDQSTVLPAPADSLFEQEILPESFAIPEATAPHLRLDACESVPRVFADALFWTVREGSADNWAQVITPKDPLGSYAGTATLVDAPFDWNAGLRVGVGRQSHGGDLDVVVYYTNFHTKAMSQAAGEVYSAFLGNFYADNTDGDTFGPHYRSASIRWDFAFHTIDLEARRSFTVAPNLTVRPFVGLKTAFIDQSVSSQWHQPIDTSEKTYQFNSATEHLAQNFWGIGPSLGVTLEVPWYTGPRHSLKLFGTPSGSLMYGHWTFQDLYRNDGPTSSTVPTTTSIAIDTSPITGAATMVSGVVGVEWNHMFSRATTTVRLGYESQIWLNQMQFYSYNMGRLNNLTSLHGGVLELSINY
jgi:hypothetical protein